MSDLGSSDQDWNQYNCDDTSKGKTVKPTIIDFIGGVQNPDRNIVYNIPVPLENGSTDQKYSPSQRTIPEHGTVHW